MHPLKYKWPLLRRIAFRNRQEIVKAGLNRRDLVKMGLLTSGGYLVAKTGLSSRAALASHRDDSGGSCELGSSPPTDPFVDPLFIPPVLPARDPATDPGFTFSPPENEPNRSINPATGIPYEGRTLTHQFRERFSPEQFFISRMRPNHNATFSDDSTNLNRIPPQSMWGFNLGSDDSNDVALSPGPLIVTRYGKPVIIRRFNELENPWDGWGVPEVSTHLHNFHSGPDSDGGPCDPNTGGFSADPLKQGRFFFIGQYYDYFYNMARAGFDTPQFSDTDGDIRETLSTLWYHDHRVDHTAENVYKGLAGMHFIFNEYDTGDESTGFRLPSFPDYDIPLMLGDRLFDEDGVQCFDLNERDGILGDKMLVNGKIQPFFEASKRRYRFRILNTGPSRFQRLFLTNPDKPYQTLPFCAITSSDGNLLPRPIELTEGLPLAVGERADVIIDFKFIWENFGKPARLYLENRLDQEDGEGPDDYDDLLSPLQRGTDNVFMEFRLVGPDTVDDGSMDVRAVASPHVGCSSDDAVFAPISLPDQPTGGDDGGRRHSGSEGEIRVTRTFEFDEDRNLGWTINDKVVDCTDWRFTVERNTAERWIFKGGRRWKHPIHVHNEEFRVVKRDGKDVRCGDPRLEYGRKDVVWLGRDDVEIVIRFRDFRGTYPMHCHNTIHEDHMMMLLFNVDDDGDTKSKP